MNFNHGMELIPALILGWLNGWVLLVLLYLIVGILILTLPKAVRARLYEYDKSHWTKKHRIFYVTAKLLVLVYFVLVIFTPLKIGSTSFTLGLIFLALGLIGFGVALVNFKNTPFDQPVSRGLYSISRHPQILTLFIAGVGICLAIGSWLALFIQVISVLFGRSRLLEEEKALVERYGESYLNYMKRVPRYLLIKTHIPEE